MAEYDNIHYAVKAKFGKPSECDSCGATDRPMYHWAHVHDAPTDPERENWLRLCVPCHHDYDNVVEGVRQANQNRVWTDSMRNHMREIKIGEGNGFYGKSHSETTKAILSEKQKNSRVECECGLITNPGNMSRHQKRTGHETKS